MGFETKKAAPMVTTTDFVSDSILVQVHLLRSPKLSALVTIPMTTDIVQLKWWWSLKILNWHLIRFNPMELKRVWKRMKRRRARLEPRGRPKDPCQWAIFDSDEAIVPFAEDVRSV